MKKKQKWTYPACVTVSDEKGKTVFSAVSQVYKIGIYLIQNNNPAQQGEASPAQMVKLMKQFRPDNLQNGTTAKFGREITVTTDEKGFYVEVEK